MGPFECDPALYECGDPFALPLVLLLWALVAVLALLTLGVALSLLGSIHDWVVERYFAQDGQDDGPQV